MSNDERMRRARLSAEFTNCYDKIRLAKDIELADEFARFIMDKGGLFSFTVDKLITVANIFIETEL